MYKLFDYTVPPIFKANCVLCGVSNTCSCRPISIQVQELENKVSISV